MADTVPASGTMDIALKAASSVVDIHTNLLHQPPKIFRSTHNSDENSPDEQEISASCADLSAVPLTTTGSFKNGSSPTNLSTITFRCERCDNFETSSRATLLLHVVQCLSSPARLKSEEIDAENLSLSAASTVVVPHVDHTNGSGSGGGNTSLNSNHSKEATNQVMTGSGTSPNGSSRKVFECDVCNMKFSNGANMRRHKMRHTGVKPYECRVCQKRFFRKDHLAEHFTTHTKTLPYHCPICNRGFQRQIAMRAHFQNEHVGQHDLVKTCPLCSYRAGSMKSLRIHFHNRHGIDLDNPGPGGSSSLLLALESQASQAAAAAAASYVPNLNAAAVAVGAAVPTSLNAPNHQSDSGDSLRSTENATPPMHFLTPHVEISMPDNSGELCNGNSAAAAAITGGSVGGNGSESIESRVKEGNVAASPPTTSHITNICNSPGNLQDEPMDCNTKSVASNSINGLRITSSPKSNHYDNHIMPSISLIPIKQEPLIEDSSGEQNNNCHNTLDIGDKFKADSDSDLATADSRKLSSLIKVSPLKSLLREDLKRRICAKANNRIIRNAAVLENNNVVQGTPAQNSTTCNATAICNGTITSSGQETESSMLNRKQMLTCLFCGIEFPDETLYFLHKGCHCESNPWKCNICGEQCNNVYEFNSHLLSKSHQ